ncbi:unnamed protein product [Rotaria magnacalcarata]|uniref:Enoyl reductase (ER) domain-containing protein n=1 Tax=Rotaria magnacalcarata TaxID=392030 RepID=A0A815NVU3_9BILA|nr:unnamed protein product [Rotaria magnacalcarata]
MDTKDSNKRSFSLFGNYNLHEPAMNVPVHSTPGTNALSPYLNFDPTVLNPSKSQFILPEGQKERRGRLELMFFTIGGSVIAGSAVGSASGLYRGLRETRELTGSVRTSSIINYVSRQGATTASAMGTIALIYSLFGTGISWARDVDDELNTVASGGLTGLLYRSTAGWKGAVRGSLFGLGLSSIYVKKTMSVPEKMRAVLLKGFGDRDNLYIGETDVPKIKDDEVLVKVHAFGVNRADTMQRKGQYPPPPGVTDIIGLEASGEIVLVGDKAKEQWNNGDKVMVLVAGGGYAEYVLAHMGCVMKIPEGISMIDAAGIPETFLTAYQGLRLIGNIKKGDIALIHAGASGVGTAAIQLAKFFGAKVATTVGSNEKIAYCKKIGADTAINYKHGPWVKTLQEFTREWNKPGFDIVYESIGKDYVEANQEVLGVDSRWIVYSCQSGTEADKLSLSTLMRKRITLSGTVLRARSADYKTNLVKCFQNEAINGFLNGKLKVITDKTWPMEQIADAHKYMEDNLTMGKLVVTIIQDEQ